MYRVLVNELTYKISKATVWSDSQTTLQYIQNECKRFQTYVANRVAEIREPYLTYGGTVQEKLTLPMMPHVV